MKQMNIIRRFKTGLAAIAVSLIVVPGVAGALPITLSGSVSNVQAFGGSPFTVGDSLSGVFDVDVAADNSFGTSSLNQFSLTVGPAVFNLSASDFGTFSGQLSDDNATLTDFVVASSFVPVPGLDGTYALGFNGVNQPFSVNGSGSIASGNFAAAVGNGGQPGPAPVAEPSAFLLFMLAVLGLGAAVRARCTRFAERRII